MGTSTNAILCYGVELESGVKLNVPDTARGLDDEFDDYNIAEMWGQVYAALRGIYPPKISYEADWKVYNVYWADLDECSSASGVEVVHHCSDAETMYLVAAAGSITLAHRGLPREVRSLEIMSSWNKDIMKFCSEMGFKVSSPKWLLCSWWG